MSMKAVDHLNRTMEIFQASDGGIRPHSFVVGPSGSGKSFNVARLAAKHKLGFLEVNAAQLTKEGMSGNSLSKALTPLLQHQGMLTICAVDEFDKLFISGDNGAAAHDVTTGVQNEFLRVLESKVTQVYGDYGKYVNCGIENILFIFMGAFNGTTEMNLDKLRDFGVKTEFLGRVPLVFEMEKPKLTELLSLVDESELVEQYARLFPSENHKKAKDIIKREIQANYETNTLGVRQINALVHQYYINGGLTKKQAAVSQFNRTLSFADGGKTIFDK